MSSPRRLPAFLNMLVTVIGISITLPVDAQPPAPSSNDAWTASDSAPTTPSPSSAAAGAIFAERCKVQLDKEAVLATAQPGTIATISVEEGEHVEQSEVVARLENDVAEAALAVAQAKAESDIAIRYAKAAYAVAQTEFEKALRANEYVAKTVPAIEVARLRLAAKQAKLQIEKAELERNIARLEADQRQAELERSTICSPLNGIVVKVVKHPGEAVHQGDSVIHVVNTEVVRVEGHVSIAEAMRLRRGDPVRVKIDLNHMEELPQPLQEKTFSGKLMFVDPTVHVINEDVRVWAQVDNPDNLLKGGTPVTMTILPQEKRPRTVQTSEREAP